MGQMIKIKKREYHLITHREIQYSIGVKIESSLSEVEINEHILGTVYETIRREGIEDEITKELEWMRRNVKSE